MSFRLALEDLGMKFKLVTAAILGVCFLLFLNFSKVNAAQVRRIKLDGTIYHGTTEDVADFLLKPEKSALVKVRVIYASRSPIKATLKSLSTEVEKVLESSVVNDKSTIEFTFYAEVTEYQLSLEFKDGSHNSNFIVVSKATDITSWEKGRGVSFDTAIELNQHDQIKGVMGFGDEKDSYKLVLNSESSLKFKLKNLGDEAINIKYYDTYKQLLYLDTVAGGLSSEHTIPKANGVYYVVMDRVYPNGMGTVYEMTTGDYEAITKLTFSSHTLTLTEGKSKIMKVAISPEKATEKYTFKSSNKSVATVSSNGRITAKKPGSATITVYSLRGRVKDTVKVTVKAKPLPTVTNTPTPTPKLSPTPLPTQVPVIEITGIKADANIIMLKVAEKKNITYTITPSNATHKTVDFKSMDDLIATVDDQGVITGVSKGTVIVSVTTQNDKVIFITVIVN